PPTLITFRVKYKKIDNIVSNEFKNKDNHVVLIPLDIDKEGLIDFQQLEANYTIIKELIDKKLILSAQSIKYGGIGRTMCEMAFGNKIGFRFNLIEKNDLFTHLFGSIIVELSIELDLEQIFKDIDYKLLGETIGKEEIQINSEVLDLEELIQTWESPLEDVFPIARKELK